MTPGCVAALLAVPMIAFSQISSSGTQPLDKLKSPDPSVRQLGVAELKGLKDAKIIPILREALKDSHPFVRAAAAEALSFFGRETSRDLVEHLDPNKEKDPAVRRSAAAGLAHAGDFAVVPALVKALKDSDAGVRYAAVRSLDVLRPPDAALLLQEFQNDADPDMRRTAVSSLAQLGDPRSLKPLVASLADKDASIRAEAVKGLANLDGPQAREALKSALKDDDPGVRLAAVSALALVGDAHGSLPALDKAFTVEKDSATKSAIAQARKRLRARLGLAPSAPSAVKPKPRAAAKGKRP